MYYIKIINNFCIFTQHPTRCELDRGDSEYYHHLKYNNIGKIKKIKYNIKKD